MPSDERPAGPAPSETKKERDEQVKRDLQKFQALQMLMERASGATIPDLAAKYQLDPDRVQDKLGDLWKEGYLKELEAAMIEKLAPLVMAVYEAQLRIGSLEAARDIGGTIGLIKRPGSKDPKPVAPKSEPVVDSIEAYRKLREANRLRAGERRPRAIEVQ